MYRPIIWIPVTLALALAAWMAAADEKEISSDGELYTLAQGDPDYDSMPNAPGKDEVYSFCSACHSMKLVTQQNLSRKRWEKLLVWMVEDQGMAPLPEEEEKIVLDYLSEHYGSKTETGTSGG
jgi:hypothetical protein